VRGDMKAYIVKSFECVVTNFSLYNGTIVLCYFIFEFNCHPHDVQ
jgi:hypothetical protein